MGEEQEYIEITEENWEQFVGQEVQVSDTGAWHLVTIIRTFYGYVKAHPSLRIQAGESVWKYARIAKPKEKTFKVSPDHREIFEALAKGALIRTENEVINRWCSVWPVEADDRILLTPDYTRPLADQEWIRMEVSE